MDFDIDWIQIGLESIGMNIWFLIYCLEIIIEIQMYMWVCVCNEFIQCLDIIFKNVIY